MNNYSLLLIDDDQELCELLAEFLGSEGFTLHSCFDGISGIEQAKTNKYDLILLDVEDCIFIPNMNNV